MTSSGKAWTWLRIAATTAGVVTAMVAVATGVTLAATRPAADTATVGAGIGGGERWIIGASTLRNLLATDSSGIVKKTFDTASAFVVVSAKLGLPAGWVSTPVETFTDETTLAQTLAGPGLLPGVRAVLYDAEHWQYTPTDQQQNPAMYYALAAQVAHQHGLRLIATPAMNLAYWGRRSGETLVDAYLRLGIPAAAARHADVFEVQSQGFATPTTTFASLLSQAAAQAQHANPAVAILGGLTTNYSGNRYTPSQLAAAVHAAPTTISGFWMNDPANSTYCPQCTGPYPQVVIDLLHQLSPGSR